MRRSSVNPSKTDDLGSESLRTTEPLGTYGEQPTRRKSSNSHRSRKRRFTGTTIVGKNEAIAGLTLSSIGWILWSLPAFRNPFTLDLGLAYHAGDVAWRNGHPETVSSWDGTSFLAMSMAFISRVFTETTSANVLTALNVALLIAMVVIVWWNLRMSISRWYWWGSLAATSVFGPAVSTVAWKQFNVIGIAFAACGYWVLQKRRSEWPWLLLGTFLIALSISIKPVVVLVVLGLLIRRDSRLAGILSALWIVAMELMAVVFMALRAHSVHELSPLVAYDNFATKTLPGNLWVCNPENFSPQSILCRMGNPQHYWTVQHIVVIVGVLLFFYLATTSVRGDSGFSWRVFAYACAFSPMVSPLAWSHYQLMLAPLLIVMVCDFAHRRPAIAIWLAALAGYVLCELVWRPYGTLPGVIVHFFTSRVETLQSEYTVFAWAAWAQYIIIGVAIVYYAGVTRGVLADVHPRPTDGAIGSHHRASSSGMEESLLS